MLSTFENAQRQHLRRKERERHLQYLSQMDQFARSYEFDEYSPSALADGLSGLPLQKTPHRSTGDTPCWKKNPILILVVSLLICLILIVFLVGVDFGENEQSSIHGDAENKINMEPTALRQNAVAALILDWGLTSAERLEDVSSPAALALEWLVYKDAVSVASPTIRTRFALACLYFATQNPALGKKWTFDRHWLSTSPVCSWYGIECLEINADIGLLLSLNLSSNALTGTIPDEIGLLGLDIRTLDMSENNLTGTIPDGLFLLGQVESLYLGPNALTGSISTLVGNLRTLNQLYLNDCHLTGLIPNEVGKLSSLEVLALQNNVLSGSLPRTLTQLSNIALLYLDNNALTGALPDDLGNMTNVADLRLRLNMFSGSIPSSIKFLGALETCYLDSNRLTGSLPAETLGNLDLLSDLQLYDNALNGTLPDAIGNLESLRVLYLDSNHFTGSIPDSIIRLKNLESLYLFGNGLNGTVPQNIQVMTSLQQLRLDSNSLSGTVPYGLGFLSDLELLYLNDNYLSGDVPATLGGLELIEMMLHGNNITGRMPLKVCAMVSYHLKKLTADCASTRGKVECHCCTRCY